MKKSKRFYKQDEMVWVVASQKVGKVISIDKGNLEMTVEIDDGGQISEFTGKMWEFDKLKYAKKEEVEKESGRIVFADKNSFTSQSQPSLFIVDTPQEYKDILISDSVSDLVEADNVILVPLKKLKNN